MVLFLVAAAAFFIGVVAGVNLMIWSLMKGARGRKWDRDTEVKK
jgi:hypothetical protein